MPERCASRQPQPGSVLGAQYPSPKKVNLANYSRNKKPQKVKGYLLTWVAISGVISPLIWVISIVRLLITLLILN